MKAILLAADPSTILTYILGIIIIIAGGVMVARYLKTKKGQEELKKFIDQLEDVVRTEILEFLAKLDFSKILEDASTLAAAEAELIHELYQEIWKVVQTHLDEIYGDNSLYLIMKANLTEDFIRDFADMIVQSKPVQDIIYGKIEKACDTESADALEAEYEEINRKIEDDTLADKEVPEINLQEAMPDLEPIIPPTEDGEEIDYNIDEVVGEKKDEVSLEEISATMVDGDDE